MKVVIIGSGNVATVLARKIAATEHEIIQIAARNIDKAIELSSFLKTTYTTNFVNINRLADIYVIAVSDQAVATVAGQLKLIDQV
ncbi:MAG: NAD(P)-binding domain-containing protein, partial [Bacteroidota bacterium]|nr:NAD(P)-binding domain-containing protein [Bacteroidota bacterium]